jgi:DNA modification methylase
MIQGKTYTVHIGNNLDILPTLPDNSVDSIVTDPPYELGFMGKKWDNSGIAYSVELWRECLRVLKPGGHLLSFGGTRTWHRVAVGIEDAGFEVRDSIAWMYGSGFPKSLDVSKAIDKRGGLVANFDEFKRAVRNKMKENNVTSKQLTEALGNAMLSHYLTNGSQPAIPNLRDYLIIRDTVQLGPDFDHLFKAEAEREVIGSKMSGIANAEEKNRHTIGASKAIEVDITAPSTAEAQQWEGWGTALKPAFEPIVVARKPLIGTVAENVLTHGTGGLNIDGSRIATDEVITNHSRSADSATSKGKYGDSSAQETHQTDGQKLGRWPANVILDEYSAGVLDEQSDASRFFYVAKASKRDRNEGLDDLPLRKSDQRSDVAAGLWAEMEAPKQNFHPTVKPTQLMRYLVKLVTPPGGTVLDPFTGSGSTGKAAILEGFKFIGCELTEDYIPIIEGRLKHAELMKDELEAKEDEALF